MKYNYQVIGLLVALFFLTQVIGLGLLSQDIIVEITPEGEVEVVHPDTVIGERPEVEGGESVLFVLLGVFLGTILILLIIRFAKVFIWRALFFVAVITTTTIALGVLISAIYAFVIALILTIVKVFRPNIFAHNLTELLIYSGIAIVFVPIFTIEWAIVLLLVISGYDAFAVWQSRHMIKMAKFQTKSRLFAGIVISGDMGSVKSVKGKVKRRVKKTKRKMKRVKKTVNEAILGGGDIAFPLIFSGVVMEGLIREGLSKQMAYLQVLTIPIVLAVVIFLLLVKGEKGKFYPAMPFITAGCLLGWGITLLF